MQGAGQGDHIGNPAEHWRLYVTFILGIDIGYSNLKPAFGDEQAGAPSKPVILPAGARRQTDQGPWINGGSTDDLAPCWVSVDGERWLACVAHSELSVPRELA